MGRSVCLPKVSGNGLAWRTVRVLPPGKSWQASSWAWWLRAFEAIYWSCTVVKAVKRGSSEDPEDGNNLLVSVRKREPKVGARWKDAMTSDCSFQEQNYRIFMELPWKYFRREETIHLFGQVKCVGGWGNRMWPTYLLTVPVYTSICSICPESMSEWTDLGPSELQFADAPVPSMEKGVILRKKGKRIAY